MKQNKKKSQKKKKRNLKNFVQACENMLMKVNEYHKG